MTTKNAEFRGAVQKISAGFVDEFAQICYIIYVGKQNNHK